ncbi:MAG: trigger factor [Candidatus Pacebacteria bacterium]|nr:trigger factor [Candidatus Paceibacterota bacterium]
MDVDIEDLSGSKVKINLRLSGEEFSPYLVRAAKELSKTINIPGFRPGKAPQKIIEEKIGKGKITEEAAKIALNENFPKIVSEKKIKILGPPQAKIDFPKIEETGEFKADIETAVFPEVKLDNWRRIAREEKLKEIKIEQKEIEDALSWLQKSRAKRIRKFKPAAKGDEVTIDYKIRSEGVRVENGDIKDQKIIIGEGKLIPDFEKNLLGLSEGEEKNFSVMCPSNFWKKELRGKNLDFKVKLKEIFRIELPELNDDFVKSLGDFKDKKSLKDNIKEGIKAEKEAAEEKRWQGAVLDKIAKNSQIEVPEILVKEQRDRMLDDLKKTVEEQMGLPFNTYLSQVKKTEEDLKKEFIPEAKKRVKIFLCIYDIAERENIMVQDEEVEKEIEETEKKYPQLLGDIKNKQSEEDFRNFIREKILEKKVMNLLKEARG